MVARGEIPTAPNGRIDPSAAFAELLRRDPGQHRLKVLREVRARIDDAEQRAQAAEERASSLAMKAGRLRELARALVRELLEASARLDHLVDELGSVLTDAEVERALEIAHDLASRATETDLLAHVDEELEELLRELREEVSRD